MNVDESVSIDVTTFNQLMVESSHELVIFGSSGLGGAAMVAPDNPSKIDRSGRSWTIPIPAGESVVQIISKTGKRLLPKSTVWKKQLCHRK